MRFLRKRAMKEHESYLSSTLPPWHDYLSLTISDLFFTHNNFSYSVIVYNNTFYSDADYYTPKLWLNSYDDWVAGPHRYATSHKHSLHSLRQNLNQIRHSMRRRRKCSSGLNSLFCFWDTFYSSSALTILILIWRETVSSYTSRRGD